MNRSTLLASGILVGMAASSFVPSIGGQTSAAGPTCFGQPSTIIAVAAVPTAGSDGDDVIWGTNGDDIIDGKGGNDRICGRGGNDTIN